MGRKRFLFISPHLDDAVLSCGGYIGKLRKLSFPVTVMTLFSGSQEGKLSLLASVLHNEWRLPKDAPAVRREEDKQALALLGAEVMHANFLDCIYRRDKKSGKFVYKKLSQILDQDVVQETGMIDKIAEYLQATISNQEWDIVFAPLALGGHIDHRIVHEAVQRIIPMCPETTFHFYEDLPYAIDDPPGRQLIGQCTNYICYSNAVHEQKFAAMQQYSSQIKSINYSSGIDIDAIMRYGLHTGVKANFLGERVWLKPKTS